MQEVLKILGHQSDLKHGQKIFAAYMEGGKNKSKVPKEIADMIEEYFEKNIEKHSSNDTMKQGLIGGGKQSAIRKHTHQRTANMSSSEYARAKDLCKKIRN